MPSAAHATNGDVNGGLAATGNTTFDVDAVVPTIAFEDPGYTAGNWTNTPQTVQVVPDRGPSGLGPAVVQLDGSRCLPERQVTR